jgi:hypothetical protein
LKGFGAKSSSCGCKHKELIEKTMQEKYGGWQTTREKAKKTSLERYGVEHAASTKEVKEKIRQACLDKYGVGAFTQTEQHAKKKKETLKRKYNVSNSFQIPEVRERTKKLNLENYGMENPSSHPQIREKVNKTNLERYGDHPSRIEEFKQKSKKTNLEKYGKESYAQTLEYKERVKQTSLNKYGVEFPSQSSEIKEKMQETCLDKYGVKYALQAEEIRTKIKQTCLEKYGAENVYGSPEIRKKIKQVSLDRFGFEYAMQNPEVKERAKQTSLERYGEEYVLQVPEVREKARQTTIDKYGVEYASQAPEIQQKIKQNNLDRYGVAYTTQLLEVKNKIKKAFLDRYGVEHPTQLPENRDRLRSWCEENLDKLFTSNKERALLNWIQSYYPSAQKIRKGKHELDIFIPELALGIEFNGLYWHNEFNKDRNYHLEKTNFFKQHHNIRVIHIFEHEWIEKEAQVKSFLQSAINKNAIKVGARRCSFVWSNSKEDKEEASIFLDNYHIQGRVSCDYVVKVLHEDQLVAVATFGKHHRNSKNWVLSRFCTKTDYTIQGALAKLSKMASKELRSNIVSWAHFRLSNGNGYKKAGWVEEALLPPDYFYHKGFKVISKQSRQKKKVETPEGMTEHQHALQDGLSRIYDCGKIRFLFKY